MQHFSDFGIKIWYSQYILLTLVTVYAIIQFYFIKPLKARFQNVMVSIIVTYFSVKFLFLIGAFVIDLVLFQMQLSQKGLAHFPAETVENGGQFLWLILGLSFIPVVFLFGGIISGGIRIKKEFVEIYIRDLPESLEGFKIVQLSDIHLGSFFRRSRVAHGVDLINEEEPDLICVTGDLVNFRSDELQGFENILNRLKAKHGVYSVLGNHDYGDYTNWPTEQLHQDDIENMKLGQQLMGWDLLLNEHRVLTQDNSKIGLVGVENWGKGFRQSGDFDQAIQGMPEVNVTILMSHDPSHFTKVVQEHPRKMHLTLAGHTHGFQMGVENRYVKISPARFKYKYWGGLYEENDRYLYVNRGFGFLGYPGRIGIPSEITVLTLTSHSHKKFEKSSQKIRHNVAKKRE
ncbi:MAG: metallophosphoesterase [Crocinitomicaceae bacterium]|nr:metallophosphoesterase [Crocinitomicaceae bacterium]